MIFERSERVLLPSVDLLSYVFDNDYDADRPILIDVHNPTRSISCRQARQIVCQLVAGLRTWGVKPGDCVAIHSFNDIYYSMLVLAIVGAGGVYTGTSPAYTSRELIHHFKTSETRFVISEPEVLAPVLEAARQTSVPDKNILIFDVQGQKVPPGRQSWKTLFAYGEGDWIRFDDEQRAEQTTAARLFSSGTTGLPKAVTITHSNLVAQHELSFETHPQPYQISRMVALPVFHAAAAPVTHFGSLKSGHITYMMRRFELGTFLAAVQKYEITDLIVVPAMAIAILMSPLTPTQPFLRSVRNVICGAAPLGKDLQAQFGQLLAEGVPFTQVWGMTELTAIGTMFPYPEQDGTGSVGRLIANLQAKLIDETGTNISAYGVRGELCVRGPTITPGYFKNDAANAEAFDADGWFKTGDIAYCDAHTRKWYIVDRRKELIKVRGFQVAPPELEAVLLGHPDIIDAAVIGITSPGSDEEAPRAYVIRRPGQKAEDLTEHAVQQYVEERVAKYKALTGGVLFVTEIPKNANGKIMKRILREESRREIQAGLRSRL